MVVVPELVYIELDSMELELELVLDVERVCIHAQVLEQDMVEELELVRGIVAVLELVVEQVLDMVLAERQVVP